MSGNSRTYQFYPGQRFGSLRVIAETEDSRGRASWDCLCDCGNFAIVTTSRLHQGSTKSCSCRKKTATISNPVTHGKSYTRTYRLWVKMKTRCYNPKSDHYKYYGGRGIKVCERWLYSFENFLEDMGECPAGYQIDRILVDGDYEKSNCRWVTAKQNMANQQRSDFSLVVKDLTTEQLASILDILKRED